MNLHIVEATLGVTTSQRSLTTFETGYRLTVTGSRILTLVTSSTCTTAAGRRTTTQSFALRVGKESEKHVASRGASQQNNVLPQVQLAAKTSTYVLGGLTRLEVSKADGRRNGRSICACRQTKRRRSDRNDEPGGLSHSHASGLRARSQAESR